MSPPSEVSCAQHRRWVLRLDPILTMLRLAPPEASLHLEPRDTHPGEMEGRIWQSSIPGSAAPPVPQYHFSGTPVPPQYPEYASTSRTSVALAQDFSLGGQELHVLTFLKTLLRTPTGGNRRQVKANYVS